MEAARLALEYLKAFLTPAPLAAGIVLFLLWKYREAIDGVIQLLASQSEFRRKLDTGAQMNHLGSQFLRVGKLYDTLLDDKIITPEQYRKWATFAGHFKTAYPEAIDLWKDATESTGRAVPERARAEVLALTKALTEFEATAYRHLTGNPLT